MLYQPLDPPILSSLLCRHRKGQSCWLLHDQVRLMLILLLEPHYQPTLHLHFMLRHFTTNQSWELQEGILIPTRLVVKAIQTQYWTPHGSRASQCTVHAIHH